MPSQSPSSDSSPGLSRVGRFYVTRELGRGTTGCVYLGHDPVVGRDIAIKTLNPRLTFAERNRKACQLINEARAAGRLAHPHIVTVYDASSEGTTPYIAMEYLQGQELHRILASGRRYKPDEVASIAWKLADALDHAHRNQVIHRDIKPSNIFLISDDHPKLMDFGIARAPNRMGDSDGESDPGYTMFRPNSPLGTPNYMSPEQAQGKPADERSDIYSLGAVMFEMLTGRTPFEAEDTDALLQQIAFRAPPIPFEIDPNIPHRLSHIVMKAMSKRPEKRYQDAQKMALEIKRFLLRERRDRRRELVSAKRIVAAGIELDGVASRAAGARLWPLAATMTVLVAVAVAAFGFYS